MPLTIFHASHWAFSGEVEQAANTPIWVPITILLLMLLLLLWGLTRGNVLDENLPDVEGSVMENSQHGDLETH